MAYDKKIVFKEMIFSHTDICRISTLLGKIIHSKDFLFLVDSRAISSPFWLRTVSVSGILDWQFVYTISLRLTEPAILHRDRA